VAKELCKLKKNLSKQFEEIAALVDRPRFLCIECGRAANEKRRLCEPKRIPTEPRKRSAVAEDR
jgi:hypothetical protein